MSVDIALCLFFHSEVRPIPHICGCHTGVFPAARGHANSLPSCTGDTGPLGIFSAEMFAFLGRGRRAGHYRGFLLACYDEDSEGLQAICKVGAGGVAKAQAGVDAAPPGEGLPAVDNSFFSFLFTFSDPIK